MPPRARACFVRLSGVYSWWVWRAGSVGLIAGGSFGSFGTVPPLRLLADELPRDTDAVATQLLPELGGARVGDEDHGHDLLLCDVI